MCCIVMEYNYMPVHIWTSYKPIFREILVSHCLTRTGIHYNIAQ